MSFPFEIYSKFSGSNEKETTIPIGYSNSTHSDSLAGVVNKFAHSVANLVIRSSNSNKVTSLHISFPKDLALFAGVLAAKSLLFLAYKAASENGLDDIMEL